MRSKDPKVLSGQHNLFLLFFMQGLSGQPLSGPDIGGFIGNATPRLFARWMGIGTLLPFSRGHSESDTHDHEPWAFGAEVHIFRM